MGDWSSFAHKFISSMSLAAANKPSCVMCFMRTRLGGFSFVSCVFMKMKQGWWSDNLFMCIPACVFDIGVSNLQKMLSIRVPLLLVRRVGKVICGVRLWDITRSKNSLYNMLLWICKRFILVSPAKIILWFGESIQFNIGVISSKNSRIIGIVDLGGLYRLNITNGFGNLSSLIFMTSPSQFLYLLRFKVFFQSSTCRLHISLALLYYHTTFLVRCSCTNRF